VTPVHSHVHYCQPCACQELCIRRDVPSIHLLHIELARHPINVGSWFRCHRCFRWWCCCCCWMRWQLRTWNTPISSSWSGRVGCCLLLCCWICCLLSLLCIVLLPLCRVVGLCSWSCTSPRFAPLAAHLSGTDVLLMHRRDGLLCRLGIVELYKPAVLAIRHSACLDWPKVHECLVECFFASLSV